MILMFVELGARGIVVNVRDTDNVFFAVKQFESPFSDEYTTFRIIHELKIRRHLKHDNV